MCSALPRHGGGVSPCFVYRFCDAQGNCAIKHTLLLACCSGHTQAATSGLPVLYTVYAMAL